MTKADTKVISFGKLTRYERALIRLAEAVESIPGCEYAVKRAVLEELGLEKA